MNFLVELLDEKNEYLNKFYNLNEKEILNIDEDNFENLENFYTTRECLLQMIEIIDKRIDSLQSGVVAPNSLSKAEKDRVKKCLDKKNNIVQAILNQDLLILSKVENEKSQIIKELKQSKMSKKAIGSYKSNTPKINKIDESY